MWGGDASSYEVLFLSGKSPPKLRFAQQKEDTCRVSTLKAPSIKISLWPERFLEKGHATLVDSIYRLLEGFHRASEKHKKNMPPLKKPTRKQHLWTKITRPSHFQLQGTNELELQTRHPSEWPQKAKNPRKDQNTQRSWPNKAPIKNKTKNNIKYYTVQKKT